MASEALELEEKDRPEPESSASSRRPGHIDMNTYANKKSAAQSMLDIALLMANASQLKSVITTGHAHSFYRPLVALISISISLQVLVGVLLIFIVKWNLNDSRKQLLLNLLENVVTSLVFIIVVVNIFITAFGVQASEDKV